MKVSGRGAVFLDRDGVINVDHGYVSRPEDFELVDGALQGAKALASAGYLLVVITNQSGIGRGFYGEDDFLRLTEMMSSVFRNAGAPLAGVYYCPHHPEKAHGKYRCVCNCRKPAPGLILKAAEELGISLSGSFFFGDRRSDMEAALSAGIPVRLLLGTDGREMPSPVPECTGVSLNLESAAAMVLAPFQNNPAGRTAN